jgi:putative ABC transport system permease protein
MGNPIANGYDHQPYHQPLAISHDKAACAMVSDLRQSLRLLVKSPGFSLLIVIVLALGIGANTAIFSIVNGVLLRPLPFADPARLVSIETTIHNEPDDTGYLDLLDWRAQATKIDRMAGYAAAAATLTGHGEATSIPTVVTTPDLFPLLGVSPIAGRVLLPDDDTHGAVRTAVISENLWTRTFNRDPGLIGQSIVLDGDPITVVGVMPARFEFPFDSEDPPQIWMPILASRFSAQWADQRHASFLKVIGHLPAGVPLQTAQAELATIAARIDAADPRNGTRGIALKPFQDVLVKNYRPALVALLSAVAAVLLIACANIANLLLARGSARRREIAIRTALGASRLRVVRQLLVESLVLAAIGGLAGTVLALWGVDALVRISPVQIPRLNTVHIDRTVLIFTLAASMLTGALCGVLPALQLSRTKPGEALKDGDRGGSGGHGTQTRRALVVAEVALSLMLLASAGLLLRSLELLQRVSPGFTTEHTLTMQLLLPQTRYSKSAEMIAFYHRLHDEVAAVPAVSASAVSTTLPMTGSDIGMGFVPEGHPVDPKARTVATFFGVSPDYFSTLGIRVIRGRGFTTRDDEHAPNVMVISETMAAKYWPGEDPIGKRVTIGYNSTGPREIVGVAADVRQTNLTDPLSAQMYAPFVQAPWPFLTAVARTQMAPEAAAGSMRQVLARLDPEQAAGDIRTFDQYVARTIATPRFTAILIGAFAGLALLLAGFGLYAVMAYAVVQRSREIGIRMALGAQARDVRGLVVREATRLGAVGLLLGLAGSVAVTRLLGSLLFGVGANDPATFIAVSTTLIGVLILAAYLPARRATQVDPIVALRAE